VRPEDRDPAYLWDMIEAARAIVDFTRDLTPEEFLTPGRSGEIMRLAVERELEILGEAAHRVSLPFRNEHVEIPWKEMVGLRNVISHEYDKVDYMEIYRIVCERIPELITLLEPLVPPPPRMDE
jgi:uncharacterized protein with HEPN domain